MKNILFSTVFALAFMLSGTINAAVTPQDCDAIEIETYWRVYNSTQSNAKASEASNKAYWECINNGGHSSRTVDFIITEP